MIDPAALLAASESLTLAGCPAGYQPWLLADLARASKARAVFIAADEQAARAMLDAAVFFAPELETVYFPAWDCLPYDRASPSLRVSSERLAALAALGQPTGKAQLLVTTVNAALQRTLVPARIAALTAQIKAGARIDRDKLALMLSANGFVRADTVIEAGEYAVRGGLLDLFPAGSEHALRLDFFGDEIESVRAFDPATQRTVGLADGFTLLPVNEVLLNDDSIRAFRAGYLGAFGANATGDALYSAISEGRRLAGMEHWLPLFEGSLATLFDHIGDGAVIVRDAGSDGAAEQRFEAISDYHDNRQAAMSAKPGSYRPLPPETLYLGKDEWRAKLASARVHLNSPFSVPDGTRRTIDCEAVAPRDFTPERTAQSNVYDAVKAHIDDLRKAKTRIVLASYSTGSRERLQGLLADHGVTGTALADSWQQALGAAAKGSVALTVLPLEHGFTQNKLAVLTEQDMLGDRLVHRRRSAKKADAFLAELSMLTPGDLLVHKDHGIGRYEGLVAVAIGKAPHDCVMLSYDGGDKLYVPVENIDVLSRYGSESDGVGLDKLGGVQWQSRKARMKERIRAIAGELMAVAAQRALREADAAIPDPHGYAEFADRFPYAETEDQQHAIDDVLADLASGRPMDRLVCGDVGFGKTEVALRAAYAAALSGMQVAVVCPTTLLARQHFAGFRERFAGLPVEVRQLSRLVTAASANEARAGLADGTVDIVIGTHALLAKSVAFKRLGLVIVDEEQRFGVEHKEFLKQMRVAVDMLTMSATPIPRTLEMSLTGIREMSTILTPPEERHPVLTFVGPYDEKQVVAAIRRELLREGQVFFLHNRVESIERAAKRLGELVPEARIAVGHGQMSEDQLEQVMVGFWEKSFDVLVCTTIVESGLDIPNANTLIVERADAFGLSQLHQIRGRVGRGRERAYAYFTYPPEKPLTELAYDRLATIAQNTEIGAGMAVAMKDLEIRGAGNLLGGEQSGHIASVGFDLYMRLVGEAVGDFKKLGTMPGEDDEPDLPDTKVDLPVDAHLPHDYVPGERLRLSAYRSIAAATDEGMLEAVREELLDRYGLLPPPVQNLLAVAGFRTTARRYGLREVSLQGKLVRFAPMALRESQVMRLQRLFPGSMVKGALDTVLVPQPMTKRIGGVAVRDTELLAWCAALLEAVLEPLPAVAT